MAGNKFATMLHHNTHMIAVVLVYTLLEWVLIGLLLLNALFFYLISRYVAFFGLKPPCILCTRVDHLLDPHPAHTHDIVCDDHAAEIAKRGNRDRCGKDDKKVFGGSGMCEDFLAETWREREEEEEEDVETEEEDDDEDDETVEEDKEGEEEKVNGAEEEKVRAENEHVKENKGFAASADIEHMFKHGSGNDALCKILDQHRDDTSTVTERVYKVETVRFGKKEGRSIDKSDADDGETAEEGTVSDEGTEVYVVEIVDRAFSPTGKRKSVVLARVRLPEEDLSKQKGEKEVEAVVHSSPERFQSKAQDRRVGNDDGNNRLLATLSDVWNQVHTSQDTSADCKDKGRELPGALGTTHVSADSSLATPDDELSHAPREPEITLEPEEQMLQETIAEMVTEVVMDCERRELQASENNDKSNGETNFGEAKPNDVQHKKPLAQGHSMERHDIDEFEAKAYEDHKSDGEGVSEVTIGSEICEQGMDHVDNQESFTSTEHLHSREKEAQDNMQGPEATSRSHHLSLLPEHDDLEENNSLENAERILNFNKKGMFDRRESLTESMDGSVASEADSTEILTTDQLTSALKAERKALSALFAELEEERNASAIAAHQTMAMITRLQEDKAAMQMEALQYQRMMEEQSEYDQDALHLLDDLAKKREKEKQELMKELEIYREKVHIYEAKACERMSKEKNDQGSDSVLPSGDDEVESSSLNLNKVDNADGQHKYSSTTDTSSSSGREHEKSNQLSTLNEELAVFEEERVSILEQLKSLGEKLLALDDTGESTENINNDNEADHPRDSVSMLTSERERLAIAEEMDFLYQRLHALEEDKTFLKRCINSLKNGDKEMDPLYETFQHLRSLRNSEQKARNPSSLTGKM